jgi:hypothetical protein
MLASASESKFPNESAVSGVLRETATLSVVCGDIPAALIPLTDIRFSFFRSLHTGRIMT